MTDWIFLQLNDKWALGADDLQWILYRVRFKRVTARLDARAFIATTKTVLWRCIREITGQPTPGATRHLDAMPDTFRKWLCRNKAPTPISPMGAINAIRRAA